MEDLLFKTHEASGASNFSITASDYYDSTAINNLSVEILGDGNYSTTTGTITTNILADNSTLFDIIVRSNSSGGYFNRTYQNVNVSSNLAAVLYQAVINFSASEILTNNTINGGNFSAALQSTTNGTLYLKAGTYNITFSHPDYYNRTQEFTILPLQNSSEIITNVYNAIVNISAQLNDSGTPITTFSASAYGDEYNTTTGHVIVPSLIGQVTNISVYGSTYAAETYTHNFSSNYTELTAYLWETGGIKIYMYYETNGSAVTGVDVNILAVNGTTDFDNNTGATNEFYTTISDTGEIIITVDKNGLSERIYYETMSVGRYVILNAYLLTDDDSQLTTFQVYNQINQLVSDAQIAFYKLINGTLERVAMKQTDFSGVATINLDRNSLYILRVIHNDYLQKEVSLQPTSLLYKVYLTGTDLSYTSLFDGVQYAINPAGARDLYTNTTYDFSMSISAANNNLDWWGVRIMFINDSGGLETWINNQSISTGGFANITQTMPLNYTVVNATYFIKVDGYDSWEKNIQFFVYPLATGNNRLEDSFDDFGDTIPAFFKVLIATFITLGLVGLTARYITFNSALLGLEILVSLGFFTYLGWIELWIYLIMAVPTLIIAFLTRGGED